MPSVGGVPKGQIPGGTWWLFNILSAVMSGLAIVALTRHAFVTWSLSAPMALIMDAYNAVMQVLFGWAHPYLQAALTWLGSYVGWQPTLYPHWKDVFVVLSLIGIGMGRAYFRVDNARPEDFRGAIALILGAAITALMAGLLPLQSPNPAVQLLIAMSGGIPALLVFATLGFEVEQWVTGLAIATVTSALAALMTGGLSLVFGHASGLGLAGLAGMVVMCGLFIVILSRRVEAETDRLFWFGSGVTTLGGFVGAFVFFAIDAGLTLLMG